LQYFKNDEIEQKFYNTGSPLLALVSSSKDDFLDGSYEAASLGDLIYESARSPLANAIVQSVFRDSFKEIFDAFVEVGTFETYITVFKKIFGEDCTVEFEVPAAGKLNIDIEAEGVELSNFVSRYIEDNQYLFDEIIDYDGDNIAFQSIKGFQTEYEVEQMLFEMVPAGIYTQISLTIGA
jgi:hypothetical protein